MAKCLVAGQCGRVVNLIPTEYCLLYEPSVDAGLVLTRTPAGAGLGPGILGGQEKLAHLRETAAA